MLYTPPLPLPEKAGLEEEAGGGGAPPYAGAALLVAVFHLDAYTVPAEEGARVDVVAVDVVVVVCVGVLPPPRNEALFPAKPLLPDRGVPAGELLLPQPESLLLLLTAWDEGGRLVFMWWG